MLTELKITIKHVVLPFLSSDQIFLSKITILPFEHIYFQKAWNIFLIKNYCWKILTNIWAFSKVQSFCNQFSSVAQLCPAVRDPMDCSMPGFPCPSSTPVACSNSCPLSWWCHLIISSSAVPFSSCLQSFPASGSFPLSQFFTSGGQNIGASASALPMNIQDWFPLALTGLISLQSILQ